MTSEQVSQGTVLGVGRVVGGVARRNGRPPAVKKPRLLRPLIFAATLLVCFAARRQHGTSQTVITALCGGSAGSCGLASFARAVRAIVIPHVLEPRTRLTFVPAMVSKSFPVIVTSPCSTGVVDTRCHDENCLSSHFIDYRLFHMGLMQISF